jgi:hypothetical protein
LRGDLTRQIRTQARQERRRNHRTRLQDIGAGRGIDTIGADGAPIHIAIQKAELVIHRRRIGDAGIDRCR